MSFFGSGSPGGSLAVTASARAVKIAKETLVQSIDATLPEIGLERWLQQQLGPGVEIAWEVNDCGEATGTSADDGRDLPFCVQASAQLRDGVDVTMTFLAGTAETGLSNVPISLYFGAFSRYDRRVPLHALRDLPRFLKAR